MTSKRTSQERDELAETASVAEDSPRNFVALVRAAGQSLSDEVADVHAITYEMGPSVFHDVALSTRNEVQLQELDNKMDVLFDDVIAAGNERAYDAVALAEAYYYLTFVYFPSEAEQHLIKAELFLMRAVELLYEYELEPVVFMIIMRVYETTGSLYIMREKYAEALEILERSAQLYKMFTREYDIYTIPCDTMRLVHEEEADIPHKLRCVYMLILNHLIKVYSSPEFHESHQLKLLECEHTLLEVCLSNSPEHAERHFFVRASLNLSKVLLKLDRFAEARDHISSACIVLRETLRQERRYYRAAHCTICRYLVANSNLHCAKYGLSLLTPWNRRSFATGEADSREKKQDATSSEDSKVIQPPMLMFADINNDRKEYISPVTNTFPSDYDSAKEVFADVLKCLGRTIQFCIVEQDTLLIANAALHIADAYKIFACYETEYDGVVELYTRQRWHLNFAEKFLEENKISKSLYSFIWLKKVIVASAIFDITLEYKNPRFGEDAAIEFNEDMESNMIQHAQFCLAQFQCYLHAKT